ncbi:MAG: hypothetical protein ACO2ZZ_06360 [Cyclobacteriaceae bacterium]
MKYLFIASFLLSGNSMSAHEPNEAFFTFELKKGMITVEAELPWSMRNALIDYNPKLETSSNKEAFENTFSQYIKENLILKDKNGSVLEFQKFEELEKNGHSHQNNYLLIFQGNDFLEVTNTIMFNIDSNQANYNAINWNKTKYQTTSKKKSFKLKEEDVSSLFDIWWLLIIPFAIVVLILLRSIT